MRVPHTADIPSRLPPVERQYISSSTGLVFDTDTGSPSHRLVRVAAILEVTWYRARTSSPHGDRLVQRGLAGHDNTACAVSEGHDVAYRPAYLPGGGLPVIMATGDPRGSRLCALG